MKKFTSKKQKLGELGEKIAEMFLVKQGFLIIDRNYSTRFGEIDIIALKNNRYHFIEVKTITVSRVTNSNRLKDFQDYFTLNQSNVSRETLPFTTEISKNTTVSYETVVDQQLPGKRVVSRETFVDEYRKITNPFQNISYRKITRLIKTVEIYISMKKLSITSLWQIDGIGIKIDPDTIENSTVEYIERIHIM